MRLATDEAVEILEAHARRPAVERPCDTAFPVGRVVILAEPRSCVPVPFQRGGDRSGRLRNHVVVTRETSRPLGQKARARVVVIASSEPLMNAARPAVQLCCP